MTNFTSNIYILKQEILTFSNKISRHLYRSVPFKALLSYLHTIRKWVTDQSVIHIDDSDIVKRDGYKFETLGIVRDGYKSTDAKSVYQKAVSWQKTAPRKYLLKNPFRGREELYIH